jgi:hypothetical protein
MGLRPPSAGTGGLPAGGTVGDVVVNTAPGVGGWTTPTDPTPADIGAAAASDLTAHVNDTADAHDASAISFVPTGTIAATDVQAAIAEVASEAGGGGGGGIQVPAIAAANNLKTVSLDFAGVSAAFAPSSGVVQLARLLDTPAATFSEVEVSLSTAGVDGAALLANCFVGLYYKSGTNLVLAGVSSDQTATFKGAIGPKQIAITEASAGSLVGRGGASEPLVSAVLIGTQSTTQVQLARAAASNLNANLGLVAGTDVLRAATWGTARTTLPATIPLSALAIQVMLAAGAK